ncbi:hypothetical protein [Litorimonas haliclonae]|uniref:cell division protein FtsL n=1 Tax=Litorimonas haliclonae TaxID=2081977 RepID=UPI0039F0D380
MTTCAHNRSASKRLSAFILFVIGVALTVGLFYIKTRAQTAKEDVVRLEREIASEERAISVLEAELAFRESPERLAGLAERKLGFEPISTKTTLTVEELAETLPFREGKGPTASVDGEISGPDKAGLRGVKERGALE